MGSSSDGPSASSLSSSECALSQHRPRLPWSVPAFQLMSRSDADEEDEWDIDAELAAGLSAHRIRSAMEEALAAAIDGWKQVIRCHQPPIVATSPRPFTHRMAAGSR